MITSPLYGIVTEQECRTSTQGKDFLQVMLKTEHGTLKCFIWQTPPDVLTNDLYPHKGDFIKVESFKDQLKEKSSVVLNLPIDKISKEQYHKEYADIIYRSGSATPEEIADAMSVLFDENLFSNKAVSKFVLKCFKRYEAARIKSTPAATGNHHMYPGGLLIHTKEVLQTAKAICEVYQKKYPYVNKDVLYCAAIIHDIGKIDTYFINEHGLAESKYTERAIGHLAIGTWAVQRAWESLTLDEILELGGRRFFEEVIHCVGTHHGSREFGSIQEAQSIEAQILSMADLMSARFGMLDKTIKDLPKDIDLKEGSTLRLHSDISFFYSTGIETNRTGNYTK
jgi:3'-5' exoribonuclease